jgi:hypothetical protein
MNAPVIDQAKLESFRHAPSATCPPAYGGVMVSLGSKLGLYKAMAGAGPISAKELAARTGCAERYVREWLNAQAAGGYVDYHAVSDTYELTPEQAMVLADEDSPVFMPPPGRCRRRCGSTRRRPSTRSAPAGAWPGAITTAAATAAWRPSTATATAAAWCRSGCPRSTASSSKLEAGIAVADVGCGHGHSTLLMAQAFPRTRASTASTRTPASIEEARRNAAEAGVGAGPLRGGPRDGLPDGSTG